MLIVSRKVYMSNPSQSPAVQAAMQRRNMGMPSPQLDQVSPQAPVQGASDQPAAPSAGNGSAPQVKPSQGFQPQNQQDFIVAALAEQLKNSGKLEKEKMKMTQPSMGALPVAQTTPQQPPMPPQMPMGGGGMGEPNFMNTPSQPNSVFEFGSPSMANTSKQNQYSF